LLLPPSYARSSGLILSAALNDASILLIAGLSRAGTIALVNPVPFYQTESFMNASRIACLAAAVVIAATQWTTFASNLAHSRSLPTSAPTVADNVIDKVWPMIVVTAHRY